MLGCPILVLRSPKPSPVASPPRAQTPGWPTSLAAVHVKVLSLADSVNAKSQDRLLPALQGTVNRNVGYSYPPGVLDEWPECFVLKGRNSVPVRQKKSQVQCV